MSFHYRSPRDEARLQDICSQSPGWEQPDIEVFHMSHAELVEFARLDPDTWIDRDGALLGEGWFWWECGPSDNVPTSDAHGPFISKALALADAQDTTPPPEMPIMNWSYTRVVHREIIGRGVTPKPRRGSRHVLNYPR